MRGFVVYNMRKVADTREMQTDISIAQKTREVGYNWYITLRKEHEKERFPRKRETLQNE